jgi:CubicO group peptidase (beta-lactamase class C family)
LNKADVISFEKFVNDCLPQDFINPRLKDTKIKDLLDVKNIFPNVVSGIGISDIEGFHPYVRLDNQVLTKLYRDYVPEEDFLSNVYSNVDYAIIQLVLENYLKKDLQNLFDKYLNSYLGSNFFYTKFEQLEETVTPGITRVGKIGKSWEINNFATSIGIKANLDDLLQFARYKIEKHKPKTQDNWEDIFDQMTETWNPQVKAFESMYLIKINNSKKILASNGHSDIHAAFIAICPTTETAVIVLANSAVGTQDLGMLILRMINNNWKRKSSISYVK